MLSKQSVMLKDFEVNIGNHILINYDSYDDGDKTYLGFDKVRKLSQIPHEILKFSFDGDRNNPQELNFLIKYDKEDCWIPSYHILKVLTDYHPFKLLDELNKKQSGGSEK